MREQRERARAEKERDELKKRLDGLEAEGNPFKVAQKLWQEKKYRQAIKTGFSVDALDDGFLVDVAADDEALTQEQLVERIRKQIKQENQAAAEAKATELLGMRMAAIDEVGGHLVENHGQYPTVVWKLQSLRNPDLAQQTIGAFIDTMPGGWANPPEKIFETMEKILRDEIQSLPWLPKAPEPPSAPRSFGSETRRGPVDQPDPAKPMTFAERQKWKEQRDREWRARVFGSNQ